MCETYCLLRVRNEEGEDDSYKCMGRTQGIGKKTPLHQGMNIKGKRKRMLKLNAGGMWGNGD